MDGYRISQLAERTGVPATTLRFYETAGLLLADRTTSGYRFYGEEAVARLGFIGTAKRLGLPLEEIAELLGVWESGACADVRDDLRPRLVARVGDAERRAAELAGFIVTLRRAIGHLDALPDRTERCGPHCAFPSDMINQKTEIVEGVAAAGIWARPGKSTEAGSNAEGAEAGSNTEGEGTEGGNTEGAEGTDGSEGSEGTERNAEGATVVETGLGEHWRGAPIACSLPTLGDRVARGARWTALIADAPKTRIPEGVRITLPSEHAAQIAELAADEQACCPFFGFRLELDGPTLNLEVRAPAEAAEILDALFGAA